MRIAALIAALALASAAQAAPAPAPVGCAAPIARHDSAAALKARFGKAARIEDVPIGEGDTAKALVLFGKDKARRIEGLYWDDAMRRVSTIRWQGKGWSAGGLRIGEGLAAVTRANGRAFRLSGFDWDYGGWGTQLRARKPARNPGRAARPCHLHPGRHIGRHDHRLYPARAGPLSPGDQHAVDRLAGQVSRAVTPPVCQFRTRRPITPLARPGASCQQGGSC